MASSIDEFFDDDDFGEAELAEPAAIIHSLFKEAGSTVEAAAQRLLVSYRAHRAPSFSTIVAQIIVPLAEARLESHQYLVQLLEQLKTLLAAGCAELRPGDDISLSYELWERALRYGAPDPDDDLRDVYRQDWINTNLFAALVHEAAIEDLSSFAEHTLNLSLRRSGWRVAWKLSAVTTSDGIDALQDHVDAATQWILVCGQRLFDECAGVREHWQQWRLDLEWICGQDGLQEDTKRHCQAALARMRSIRDD